MTEKGVGKVTHYYDKIGVAVIELTGVLNKGDKIKIKSDSGEFEQEIKSMQIEHKTIEKAKKGQSIGLKVKEPVRKNDIVYKIT